LDDGGRAEDALTGKNYLKSLVSIIGYRSGVESCERN
jgi:hypothetical protein